jgi:protein-tyrosine phosphatase
MSAEPSSSPTIVTATEVVPNLWIGNYQDTAIPSFIKGFDVIINCTKNLPFPLEELCCPGVKQVRLSVEDNLQPAELDALYRYLDKVTQLIHANLMYGRRVLVHCFAGKQRSASVIVAYMMRYFRMNLENASRALQSKRACVFEPLCNFRPTLEKFHLFLQSEKKKNYS